MDQAFQELAHQGEEGDGTIVGDVGCVPFLVNGGNPGDLPLRWNFAGGERRIEKGSQRLGDGGRAEFKHPGMAKSYPPDGASS